MDPIIIAIIGGPGVGKSFLVNKLAEYFNAEKIVENVEEIPEKIIENFKKDVGQIETIIWFRNKCIRDIERALKLKEEGKVVIMDTYLTSTELHISTMTSGFEQEILFQQFKFDKKYIPSPDIVIFLDAAENKIRGFTLKRGRDFDTNEKFIQRNLSIQKAHSDYYKQNKDFLIYLNRDNLDFEKREDIEIVVAKIRKFLNSKR